MVVPLPPTPKNEDKLEILSISDDEEIAALVKLSSSETCKLPSSKQQQQAETIPYSIMDAAIKTTDTSFVLEPVREEQPRPNKLSRSRAPLNQSKPKDSKNLLMSLDAPPSTPMNSNYNSHSNTNNNSSELISQRAYENEACASTMLSSIPTSFSHSRNSNGNANNSSSSSSSGSSNNNSKNDGNLLPLNRLDSLMRSSHDTNSTTRSSSAQPIQSAVTSFANNVNSIEPELVLSPAKLGQ